MNTFFYNKSFLCVSLGRDEQRKCALDTKTNNWATNHAGMWAVWIQCQSSVGLSASVEENQCFYVVNMFSNTQNPTDLSRLGPCEREMVENLEFVSLSFESECWDFFLLFLLRELCQGKWPHGYWVILGKKCCAVIIIFQKTCHTHIYISGWNSLTLSKLGR